MSCHVAILALPFLLLKCIYMCVNVCVWVCVSLCAFVCMHIFCVLWAQCILSFSLSVLHFLHLQGTSQVMKFLELSDKLWCLFFGLALLNAIIKFVSVLLSVGTGYISSCCFLFTWHIDFRYNIWEKSLRGQCYKHQKQLWSDHPLQMLSKNYTGSQMER